MLCISIIQQNPCEQNNFIIRPLANPYMNDQFKNHQVPFFLKKNVNYRLITMLQVPLHLFWTSIENTYIGPCY